MSLPKRVTIELTNRCNRNCEGCPRQKMTYPLGDMNTSLFTEVTSQLGDYVCIVPFYRGESTLHSRFPELMNQLGRFRVVQLATNGDFLTKTNQRAILDNCTFISLSLHELKFPWQTRWLPFLYDCLGADIETQVSILETLVPENSKKHFIKEWRKHADNVRIYKVHSKNGFGNMGLSKTTVPCNKPFEDMVVYWNGKVGLCNHDWNNLTPLGDLNAQSIREVWQSQNYMSIRGMHLHSLRGQVQVCQDCDFQPDHIYGDLVRATSQSF